MALVSLVITEVSIYSQNDFVTRGKVVSEGQYSTPTCDSDYGLM